MNKERTSFAIDLLPGNYLGYVDFGQDRNVWLNLKVIKGKELIYPYIQINPYGQGKGQVVFTTSSISPIFFNLTIDKDSPITVKVSQKKVFKINLDPGKHNFQIENPYARSNNQIEYFTNGSFRIFEGGKITQPIEQ